MLYNPQNAQDLESVSLNTTNVEGSQLHRDVPYLAQLIKEGDQGLGLGSYVIAIQGGYGSGKTVAAWVFMNYLRDQIDFAEEGKLHRFAFELLSFSNINESISDILNNAGKRLWDEGVVDVRSELSQMILDALPNQQVTAQISLLGLSLQRNLTVRSLHKEAKVSLKEKMSRLYEKGHRFIFMLDELDRMKPLEVVTVTRMIENFRDIPGIIFLLPFYEKPVVAAIGKCLELDNASSHVFLRKFVKAKINIVLTNDNLRFSFYRYTDYGAYANNDSLVSSRYGIDTKELIWRILVHTIVVTEALAAITDGEVSSARVSTYYGRNETSPYLTKLKEAISTSRDAVSGSGGDILPYLTDNKWFRFGDVYNYLANGSLDPNSTVTQLRSLLNEELLVNSIYIDSNLNSELRSHHQPAFDPNRAAGMTQHTVFEEVILRALGAAAQDEPFLTQNYSRRDMEQLSQSIYHDPDFVITQDPVDTLKRLIKLVRERYNEFR